MKITKKGDFTVLITNDDGQSMESNSFAALIFYEILQKLDEIRGVLIDLGDVIDRGGR